MDKKPVSFDSLKSKVQSGEPLNSFEAFLIMFFTVAAVEILLHEWFGILPKSSVDGGSDKDVKDIQ